jgi:hypothetical protein
MISRSCTIVKKLLAIQFAIGPWLVIGKANTEANS